MNFGPVFAAALAALVVTSTAASAQQAVSIPDLAKNPDGFVGKKVVVSDCLMMSYNSIIGATCSPMPLADGSVFVDVDTLSAAGKKLGEDCNTTDINNLCLLKVTGDVAKTSRGLAVIKNATIELVRRVKAF